MGTRAVLRAHVLPERPPEDAPQQKGSGQTIAQHTLSYLRDGVYLNGNRASDTFFLKGPDSGAPCFNSNCMTYWAYDARERVILENRPASLGTFLLDAQGNVTKEISGALRTIRTYAGQQLQSEDFSSGQDRRYLYDSLGNQDCVVKL